MQIIHHLNEMTALSLSWREQGQRIAFVPTMGNLHAGHLALVEKATACADRVAVSIFVNPMQFGPSEDFNIYPRTPEDDLEILEKQGIDAAFMPTVQAMYPRKPADMSYVDVPGVSDIFCGASRPGHFRGVATVVSKLFNIVQPHVAVFGEKDFQQLLIIRRMVGDLSMPVDIIGLETQREADGLAMSSRNAYLSHAARDKAPLFYQNLNTLADALKQGAAAVGVLKNTTRDILINEGFELDYLDVVNQQDLSPWTPGQPGVILAAVLLDKIRLIDNIKI